MMKLPKSSCAFAELRPLQVSAKASQANNSRTSKRSMARAPKIDQRLFLDDTLVERELGDSRICRFGIEVLGYLNSRGSIGLTKSGSFNRKFVVWAVDQFNWPGYTTDELYRLNKVLNEDDVFPLSFLHDLLRAGRLIRHVKGKAVLTKAGKALCDDPGKLQATLFETVFTRFDFSKYERVVIEFEDADTFHFLGLIHNRLDDWVAFPELAGWCLPIVPIHPERDLIERDAIDFLCSRLIRPLLWLGLIEQENAPNLAPFASLRFRKTPLFDKFLKFDLGRATSQTLH